MKNIIKKTREKLFIPVCIFTIIYCLFLNELKSTQYFLIIAYILAALCIFFVILSIIELIGGDYKKNKKLKSKYNRPNKSIERLYFYSAHIIKYSFYTYFFSYLIFEFYKKSIIFNYLLLVIFGIFLGYRIAFKVFFYFAEKDKQQTS